MKHFLQSTQHHGAEIFLSNIKLAVKLRNKSDFAHASSIFVNDPY